MNKTLSESESQAMKDLEEFIDEKVPELRSIKPGTTGLYSFGFVKEDGYVVARSIL